MKKIIVFLLLFAGGGWLYSQSIDVLFENTNNEVAVKLCKVFMDKNVEMSEYFTENTALKIKVNITLDKNGKMCNFSDRLTELVVSKLNLESNSKRYASSIGKFKNYSFFAEQKKEFISENYNFVLTWQFVIVDSLIKFYNIKLIPSNDVGRFIALNDFFVENFFNSNDDVFSPIEIDYVKEVVETSGRLNYFNKAVIVNTVGGDPKYPELNANNFFSYQNLDEQKEYFFNLDMKRAAYCYVFAYDPDMPEFLYLIYPFIGSENEKLKVGNNLICKESPVIFDFPDKSPKKTYLKFFFSLNMLEIDRFTKQVKMDADVFVKIMNKDNAKDFLMYFYKQSGGAQIQTNQILFDFN